MYDCCWLSRCCSGRSARGPRGDPGVAWRGTRLTKGSRRCRRENRCRATSTFYRTFTSRRSRFICRRQTRRLARRWSSRPAAATESYGLITKVTMLPSGSARTAWPPSCLNIGWGKRTNRRTPSRCTPWVTLNGRFAWCETTPNNGKWTRSESASSVSLPAVRLPRWQASGRPSDL